MGRVIWNSKQGFVGDDIDFQELVHCMSCALKKSCYHVNECDYTNGWKFYLMDEQSEFAKFVTGARVEP